MDYFALSALFNFLVSLILGVFVFHKNPDGTINKSLFFWALTVSFWSLFYFLWQLAETGNTALLWARILMFGAIWVPVSFLKVVFVFLEQEKANQKLMRLIYAVSIMFSILLLTPLMVSHVEPVAGFEFWPKPGPAYATFLITFLLLTFHGAYVSVKALKTASTVKRTQIKLMLFGMTISIIGGSTNYFLWYDIPIPPYGNIFASTYVIMTVYAIIRHQILDIKLALRRSSVYMTSLLFSVGVAFLVRWLAQIVFPTTSDLFISFALLAVAITIYPMIKDKTYHIANKYFFSSLYDAGEVIAKLSSKLLSVLDPDRLYRTIDDTITGTFHTQAVSVLTYNKEEGGFEMKFNDGFNIAGDERFFADLALISLALNRDKIVVVDEIRSSSVEKRHKKTFKLLDKYGIEVVVPLNIKDDLIGVIVLGSKESKDSYNKEDLQVLEVIRAQTSIALENALLYEETRLSEKELEKKVIARTKDLQRKSDELTRANERLRQLDAAKTEFLSIASHQLRTPLSGIKGYVSMMNDGDFGAFKKRQHEILQRVGTEVDRLVRLVQVFLDVSRIESGRLNISKKEFNFVDLVKETVDELLPTAKSKGIKLTHKGRKKSIPVNADRDKLKDVLVNLVDNAVKYTPKGEVWTEISEDGNMVRFMVHDSGVGMEPDEVSRVFEKFTRGKGIDQISTSGSGLGLFIAKRIVEEHKGKIWSESKGKGKGSVFAFEIPKK